MGRGESRLKPILLLEDDAALLDGLCYALKKDGFEVTCARTAAQALCLLKEGEYGLLLLDVSLPDGTGFEVCEWVRGRGDGVPILFLTAADEEVSVMRGLDCGGDDYVTKPFRFGELCARIRALLRRAGDGRAAGDRLVCGDVSVNLASAGAHGGRIPASLPAPARGGPRGFAAGDFKRPVGQRRRLRGRQHALRLRAQAARKAGGGPVPPAAAADRARAGLPV